MSSTVSFKKKFSSIQVDGKTVPGITKLLKEVFYPKYEYEKATIDYSKTETTPGTGYKHVKGSQRLGRGFDTAVGKTVSLLKKYPGLLTMQSFLDPQQYLLPYKNQMKTTDLKSALTLANRRNPYLKMLLGFLLKKGYTPIATQVPVGHTGINCGTMIDLVVKDKKKLYRPVELKTGFENYMYKATKHKMKAPFQDKPDFPLHQHLLQTVQGGTLYKHNFSNKAGEPFLLYLQTPGVQEFHPPKWLKQRLPEMQLAIKNRA